MRDATFARPDLTTFCRLDALGLEVTGQRLEPSRAVLSCRVVEATDRWCRRCGGEGSPRDSVTRRLAHEPLGWRPTTLLVTVRRYRCGGCGHVWRQDTTRAAEPRAKLTRAALRWALEAIVIAHLTVARVAEALAVSWNTANDAVLDEGKRVLAALFATDEHVQVETTWGVYQNMIAAYRDPDRARGRSHDDTDRDPQPRCSRRPDECAASAAPWRAGRRRPGLLRPARHQQRTDGSHQRPPRTPPRLRPRVPQPHQLHRPIACSRPAASDPDYTLDREEPANRTQCTIRPRWSWIWRSRSRWAGTAWPTSLYFGSRPTCSGQQPRTPRRKVGASIPGAASPRMPRLQEPPLTPIGGEVRRHLVGLARYR